MRILYLVIHTQKQPDRYQSIMETWGKNVDILFYSDHEELPNIIKVSNNSDYNSGEEKQINIINNFPYDKMNYDWFVFVDNDSFVNTKKVLTEIESFDKNYVHGDVCNCWSNDFSLPYCLGGAGIFVSREILLKLKGNLTHNPVMWGDVSLGINLRNLNIPVISNSLCHSQPPSLYNIPENEIKNHLTFHYIKEQNVMKHFTFLCE